MFICICGREFESGKSYASHTKWCKVYCDSVNREVEKSYFSSDKYVRVSWNKGKTKETDSRILLQSIKSSESLKGKSHKHSEESISKISNTMKAKAARGELKGFIRRNQESFPEKFWKSVLINNDIDFIKEYRVSFLEFGINKPYAGYFLDFYIKKYNLDLEIDGSQHYTREEVIEADRIRDERLRSAGYLVYRIRYIDYRRTEEVKKQIEEFLQYLNSLKRR